MGRDKQVAKRSGGNKKLLLITAAFLLFLHLLGVGVPSIGESNLPVALGVSVAGIVLVAAMLGSIHIVAKRVFVFGILLWLLVVLVIRGASAVCASRLSASGVQIEYRLDYEDDIDGRHFRWLWFSVPNEWQFALLDIESLFISGQVDPDVTRLIPGAKLDSILIKSPRFNDVHAKILAEDCQVETLYIESSSLSPKGLMKLGETSGLSDLTVCDSSISDDEFLDFRRRFPKIQLWH